MGKQFSQQYLTSVISESTGISRQLISTLEIGSKSMNTKSAEKLGRVLGVGVEWLFTGNERNQFYPINDELIEWLKNHQEKSEVLWAKIHSSECGGDENGSER